MGKIWLGGKGLTTAAQRNTEQFELGASLFICVSLCICVYLCSQIVSIGTAWAALLSLPQGVDYFHAYGSYRWK